VVWYEGCMVYVGGVLDSLGGVVAHVQGSPVGKYDMLFSGYLVSMDSHLEIKATHFHE